jgi:phosphoglycerate dehydrogenase-like enzyme
MQIFLIGEAAKHRAVLDSELAGRHEVIALPPEAAHSAVHDSAIRAQDVVISLRFSRRDAPTPAFRLLHVPGAGLDGIDFDALPDECTVCNVYEHEGPIAEYACAAMLERETGFAAMSRSFTPENWSDQYRSRQPHGELAGKVLALVGYGRIGQAIARRARAFDMQVLAVAPNAVDAHGQVDHMLRPPQLLQALTQADYVVVVCPLTDTTRGMIAAPQLAQMKQDAVLINVSRAEIVNEYDLYRALSEQRIGGAVLDVWYQYPKGAHDAVMPSAFPFADLRNVWCTPHSSAWTRLLPQRRYRSIAKNILRLAQDQPLANVVRAPVTRMRRMPV